MYLPMGQPTRENVQFTCMYLPTNNKSTISQPHVYRCVRAGPPLLPRHVVGVDTANINYYGLTMNDSTTDNETKTVTEYKRTRTKRLLRQCVN